MSVTELEDLNASLEKRNSELATRCATKTNEIRGLTNTNAKLLEELQDIDRYLDMIVGYHVEIVPEVRELATPTARKGRASAVGHLLLSDTHFDEVVFPEDIGGINQYNRKVAVSRLEDVFSQFVQRCLDSPYEVRSVVISLGGDMLSGDIHEELLKTNEFSSPETIVFWSEKLISLIESASLHFDEVYVPTVSGNHDRKSFKTPFKKRERESLTWIMYNWIGGYFKDNPKVTVDVSTDAELIYKTMGVHYLLVHGDNLKAGSGGVSGLSPGLIKNVRKTQDRVKETLGITVDWVTFGHYHYPIVHKEIWGGFMLNGSLKGYDDYAKGNNLAYSPASQSFWLTTEHGVTEAGQLVVL